MYGDYYVYTISRVRKYIQNPDTFAEADGLCRSFVLFFERYVVVADPVVGAFGRVLIA